MKFIFAKKTKDEGANVKKRYTLRFYMMVLSGVAMGFGLFLFAIYFKTLNIALGLPSIIMMVAGIFTFRYYWKKETNIALEHIKGEEKFESANCLNIYSDKVEFATMLDPAGFPMKCINLGKRYYVNIMDGASNRLIPFVLPDQQYYDPNVFAQRVLGLPAHRKIFERKPKLIQKLKTALLVLAIGIVWLLIMTTTGG